MRLLETKEVQNTLLELMTKVHKYLDKKNIKYYMLGGNALGAIRHGGFIPWDDDIDIGLFREDYEKLISDFNDFDSDYEMINYKNSKNCDFCLSRIYFKNIVIDNPSIKNTRLDKRLYFDIFPIDNVPDDDNELKKYEKKISKKKMLIQRIDVRDYGNKFYIKLIKKIISITLTPFRQAILKSTDKLMQKYKNVNTKRVCSLCSQYSFKRQVMDRDIYGTPILFKFENTSFYLPEKPNEYLTTLFGNDYMEIPPVEKRRKGYNIYLVSEEK